MKMTERRLVEIVDYFCANNDILFNIKHLGVGGLDSTLPLKILYCVKKRQPAKLPMLTKKDTEAFYVLFDEIYAEHRWLLKSIFR